MYNLTTQHGTIYRGGYDTIYAANQAAQTCRNPHIRLEITDDSGRVVQRIKCPSRSQLRRPVLGHDSGVR